jgi:acyl-CoA synthetase (AMP-forming)/AMP-acid ligase II
VHAAVEVRPGAILSEEEIKSMLKRELGSVKTPKAIHVFEALPRSPVGKVLKPAIREEIVRRRATAARETPQQ